MSATTEKVGEMTTNALANWFGANRANAGLPAKLLEGCSCVCVGFAGGMCELPYFTARQRTGNDLHRHVTNLARVVADPELFPQMRDRLEGSIYHPDTLAAAQRRCRTLEETIEREVSLFADGRLMDDAPSVGWACDYFISTWMAPGGRSGMDGEFDQSLSFRFTASGGGSSVRFWSAFDSLPAWHKALRGWEFTTLDIFKFLAKCQDRAGHGLYLDPPWVEKDGEYKHDFVESDHINLARIANAYTSMHVVMRYGDCPLIRRLYPAPKWKWLELKSRNQGNNDVREAVICNFDSKDSAP